MVQKQYRESLHTLPIIYRGGRRFVDIMRSGRLPPASNQGGGPQRGRAGGDRSDQTPVLDCRVDMARVSSRPGAEGRKGGRAGPARPGMGEPDPPCARPLAWVRRTGETRGGLQPGGRSARRAGRPYRWFRGRLGGRGGLVVPYYTSVRTAGACRLIRKENRGQTEKKKCCIAAPAVFEEIGCPPAESEIC